VKTASARATEAIEAAQMMFADEMGATLDLSPAARMALIETIAAAIQTAVAEGQAGFEPSVPLRWCDFRSPLTPSARSGNLIAGDGTKNGLSRA
jgi:hypothetical protein